ncbi:MAG: hypothetical protein AVO33_05860 [delta proteobacterium ML8_F1]|nr:MAG: hypothetical protein AVO33_05860 [delta proteobacterium ML8_F1]
MKRNLYKGGIFFAALSLPYLQFRYIALIQVIFFILYCVEKFKEKESFALRGPDYALGAFYLFLTLATVFSQTPVQSAVLLGYYTVGISFYWIVSREFSRDDFVALGLLLIFGATLASLIGVAQYLGGDLGQAAWLDQQANPNIRARAYSVFMNPNVLGEYLLVALIYNMALVLMSRRFLRGLLLTIPFGINLLTLLLTFSRGAWGGFAFAAIVFLLAYDYRYLPILALVGVMSLFVLPDVFIQRLLTIFTSSGDSSTSYRGMIYFGTEHLLQDYWLFGTGLGYGSFIEVYSLYRVEEIYGAHAHNIFLEILVETGVFGLVTFLYFMAKSAVQGIKTVLLSEVVSQRLMVITGLSALSGLFLHGLVENIFFDIRIVTLVWMLFGFTSASIKVVKS